MSMGVYTPISEDGEIGPKSYLVTKSELRKMLETTWSVITYLFALIGVVASVLWIFS
jgi:hypothetical protein